MPYPAGHRDMQRERIIQSARKLFNRHGFSDVSVAQITAGAGLTHGTFYSYFDSKNDLYVEALRCFFTDPTWKNNWKGVRFNADSALGPQIVRGLSVGGAFRRYREFLSHGGIAHRRGARLRQVPDGFRDGLRRHG